VPSLRVAFRAEVVLAWFYWLAAILARLGLCRFAAAMDTATALTRFSSLQVCASEFVGAPAVFAEAHVTDLLELLRRYCLAGIVALLHVTGGADVPVPWLFHEFFFAAGVAFSHATRFLALTVSLIGESHGCFLYLLMLMGGTTCSREIICGGTEAVREDAPRFAVGRRPQGQFAGRRT
jgi:hypothetical protein